MIFNDNYNKIIELMMEVNEDFKNDYLKFINSLPEKITKKCKKEKDFDIEIKKQNTYAELTTDETYIELEVNAESAFDSSINFLLNINKIKEKELDELPINKSTTSEIAIDAGTFYITTEKKGFEYETEYDFDIIKTSKNEYCIKATKFTNKIYCARMSPNKEETTKTFTKEQLIEKLKLNTNKR